MKLRRLRLSWFRGFEDADIRFGDGLQVIIGGNGAGKSTILEAVTWLLWGAGAVRRSEASLRSLTAPPGSATAATLDFEVEGDAYTVMRTVDDAGGSARLCGADGAVVAQDGDVAAAAARLLGADRDTMLHACATGRRELQGLTRLTPAERLRTLGRLLGRRAVVTVTEGPDHVDALLEDAVHALQDELADADERMRSLTSAPELLAQYAAELERLRPELAAAEVLAERLHDEWSQKRQDVETRLAAYQRRGDELRAQVERLSAEGPAAPCPTCGQPLGRHHEGMLERLDDESWVNAQDAKWLQHRHAQLEQKPPDLVEAETRRAKLRAAVDDRRQRAARCEQAAQELWSVANERKRTAERLRQVQVEIRVQHGTHGNVSLPLLHRRDLHEVAQMAGAFVAHVTAGAYDAIVLRSDGRVYALRAGREAPVVSGGDEDLIALALRLATMRALRAEHPRLDLLLLDEPFGGLDDARRARAFDALRPLLDDYPQVVVCTRDSAAARHADGAITLG